MRVRDDASKVALDLGVSERAMRIGREQSFGEVGLFDERGQLECGKRRRKQLT